MAVPAALSTLASAAAATSTWANQVKDLTDWTRSSRPMFKGNAFSNAGTNLRDAADNTSVVFGFGQAGSFYITPSFNVDSWTTASADADPESLVVPEAGKYFITCFAEFPSHATGRRRVELLGNGSLKTGFRVAVGAVSGGKTAIVSSGLTALSASDELDVQVFQDSGGTLADLTVTLTAEWVAA